MSDRGLKPRVSTYIMGVLLTFTTATILLVTMLSALTRDLLTSLAFTTSIVGWWGWPLWMLGLAQQLDMYTAIVYSITLPPATSLALGIPLSRSLTLGTTLYVSTVVYYITGSLYFTISRNAPGIPIGEMLVLWLVILAISTLVSKLILARREVLARQVV